MESLETIGRKDVIRDNVRNPPAFYLGIIRRTAERMAGAPPAAAASGPGRGGPSPGAWYNASPCSRTAARFCSQQAHESGDVRSQALTNTLSPKLDVVVLAGGSMTA